MGSQNPNDDENEGEKTDETLTPKTAHRLTEDQGMTQTEVGKMFGITQPRVSTLKSQYKDAKEEGKDSVSPGDFPAEDLRGALADEEPNNNPFEGVECPACNDEIAQAEAPGSAGLHPCPHCGENIKWDEGELP